jgi:hypothetical protein
VPDTRSHRGSDPRDAEAFGPASLPALRAAVSELSWLLGRGYALLSALKLVGDRWNLTERQRMAVRRSACSDEARARRAARHVAVEAVAASSLWIDGFNVLTTIEAWLGGGVVLHCRDGTFRDLAGVHGSYRKVAETVPALETLAAGLVALRVPGVRWLFDRPVSNSGRIRGLVLETADRLALDWTVDLMENPDPVLKQSPEIIATADSAILDAGPRWFNLARHVIETPGGAGVVIDLSGGPAGGSPAEAGFDPSHPARGADEHPGGWGRRPQGDAPRSHDADPGGSSG